MSRVFVAAAVLITMSGCALEPAESTADNGSLICSRETPVGSNIPIRKCRTREQIELERRAADQARDAIRSGQSSSPKDSVGQ